MKVFGIIGNPLEHSFSPAYFNHKFKEEKIKAAYHSFCLQDISEFTNLVKHHDIQGLNVTIPYKTTVIPYLSELDELAKEIQSVNTIYIRRENKSVFCKGYSTDVLGFEKALNLFIGHQNISKALVLSTGGSSKAIAYVLRKKGISFRFVSRQENKVTKLTYPKLNKNIMEETQLIVNTTPLGMFPYESRFPDIPYQYLNSAHYLFDLVYHPKETIFLKKGKAQNAKTENGYRMLIFQAEAAWKIFSKHLNHNFSCFT